MRVKRRIVVSTVSLLMLALLAGGATWHFIRARQAEQIAKDLASLDAQSIRSHLEKSIGECYERDAALARRKVDRKDRQKALRAALYARDQKVARIDDFLESIRATIASGQASHEVVELTRILQNQGVEAAVQHLSNRESQLVGNPTLWARTRSNIIRTRLAPLLEGAWLQQDLGDFTASQRLCEEMLAADPEWAEARDQYVAAMVASGQRALYDERLTAAWQRFETARASAERLVQLEPNNPAWLRDLSTASLRVGQVSAQIGRFDSAIELLERVIEINRKRTADGYLNGKTKRDLWTTYEETGDLSRRVGKYSSASFCYEQSLEIAKKLAAAGSANAELQHELSISYEKLATASRLRDVAHDCLQRSLDIRKNLAANEPANTDLQYELSVLYEELGNANWQLPAAREFYQQSLDIRQKLAAAAPADLQAQRDLWAAYDKISHDRQYADRANEARELYLKELDIARKVAAADPNNIQVQNDLSVLYDNLGTLTEKAGALTAARDFHQQGLEVRKKLAAADQGDQRTIEGLRLSYSHLAHVAWSAGDIAEAVQICEQGASVLQQMSDHPQFKRQAQLAFNMLNNELENWRRVSIVAGPLDKLLQRPASELPDLLHSRCTLLAARRDIDGLVKTAEALRKLEPKTQWNLYHAAGGYALCAKLAAGWPGQGPFSPANGGTDPKAPDSKDRQTYVLQSLDLLQDAMKAGFNNTSWMQQDPDLAALHDLPAFKIFVGGAR